MGDTFDLAKLCTPAISLPRCYAMIESIKNRLKEVFGLDEVSRRQLVTYSAIVAAGLACRNFFTTAPPPKTTATVLGWIEAHAHPTVSLICSKLAPWAPLVARFAAGALAVYCAGLVAGALVPSAMSWFGTVVPGVGTMHTSGGVAATLQWLSAQCVQPVIQAIGGVAAIAMK